MNNYYIMTLDKDSKTIVKVATLIVLYFVALIGSALLCGIYYICTDEMIGGLIIGTAVSFGVPIMVYHKLFDNTFVNKNLFVKTKCWWFLIAFAMLFVSLPLVELFASEENDTTLLQLCQNPTPLKVVALVFGVAVLPAVFEEWFFRGILQRDLSKLVRNDYLSIVITAMVFSLIHFDMANFVSRFILGLLLGLLFFYSKSLWVNIFVHFLNNLFAVLLLFSVDEKELNEPTNIHWSITLLSALIFIAFILFFERYRRRTQTNQETENIEKENILS